MRLEIDEDAVPHVYLSKRNLQALLTKLENPESACTIEYGEYCGRRIVRVTAEHDESHYSHPERKGAPPGPMVDWTESAIRQMNCDIKDDASQQHSRSDSSNAAPEGVGQS